MTVQNETVPLCGSGQIRTDASSPHFQGLNFIANGEGRRFIANDLHNAAAQPGFVRPLRAAIGGWLCFLLLFYGMLGANPRWHHCIHGDGDTADSTGSCPIELLESGAIDLAIESNFAPSLVENVFWSLPFPVSIELNHRVHGSLQNRGPPIV